MKFSTQHSHIFQDLEGCCLHYQAHIISKSKKRVYHVKVVIKLKSIPESKYFYLILFFSFLNKLSFTSTSRSRLQFAPPQYFKIFLGHFTIIFEYVISCVSEKNLFKSLPVRNNTPWYSETVKKAKEQKMYYHVFLH